MEKPAPLPSYTCDTPFESGGSLCKTCRLLTETPQGRKCSRMVAQSDAMKSLLQRAAMVADTAPAALRGTAFGVFNLLSGGCMLVASVLAGWLWQTWGAATCFYSGALFAALACLLLQLRPGWTRYPVSS